MRGLQYLLAQQLQQLDVSRDVVANQLDKLVAMDPGLLVDDVVQCCLRPPSNNLLVNIRSITFVLLYKMHIYCFNSLSGLSNVNLESSFIRYIVNTCSTSTIIIIIVTFIQLTIMCGAPAYA